MSSFACELPDTRLSGDLFDRRLAQGWFRSGPALYRGDMLCLDNELRGLQHIRLPLARWQPSRSQRRVIKRNRRQLRCTFGPARIDAQRERLYHAMKPRFQGAIANELQPLIFGAREPLFDTRECCVYDGQRLVAVSYFDMGERSMASQIALYEPAYRHLSLGLYTMLEEIDYAIEHDGSYYYPGYLIPGASGFAYKLQLRSLEYLASGNSWHPLPTPPPHLPAVDAIMARVRQLENVLSSACIDFERWSYPAFWINYLDNGGADYLRALLHLKCSNPDSRGAFHVIEYLHEDDEYQLSLVRPDTELNVGAHYDTLPAHCQPVILCYECILCRESSAEALAGQFTSLTGERPASPAR